MSVVVRMEMPKGCWDCPCVNGEYGYCQADKEERQIEDPNERPSWCPIIAASPWHRVKDGLPKPHKDVLVSGMEAINNMRVYKVMVNDNGTWRPTDYAPSIRWDYWMPIEPPGEDADADK